MKQLKRVLALLLVFFLLGIAYLLVRTEIRADVARGPQVQVVVNDAVGVPLSASVSVRVALVPKQGTPVQATKRDTAGYFVLVASSPGDYTLEVTADGYTKQSRIIEFHSNVDQKQESFFLQKDTSL